jgi:hypothetical protein
VDPAAGDGDVVRAPFADVAVSTIDPADIRAVAARALLSGIWRAVACACRARGAAACRPVRILGATLGRDLRFEAVPDDADTRSSNPRITSIRRCISTRSALASIDGVLYWSVQDRNPGEWPLE